jgi:hypothetical protein
MASLGSPTFRPVGSLQIDSQPKSVSRSDLRSNGPKTGKITVFNDITRLHELSAGSITLEASNYLKLRPHDVAAGMLHAKISSHYIQATRGFRNIA